jgi:asparaginyl-tRNA synthetase
VQGAGQFAFVELSDGSCFTCIQVVVNKGVQGWEAVEKNSHIGCSFMFQGEVVESQGKGQAIEIKATRATLFGACDPNLYPLSKGRLPLEHLRNYAHVRPRTNTIGAVARVRSCLATAVHEFFQQKVHLLPSASFPLESTASLPAPVRRRVRARPNPHV